MAKITPLKLQPVDSFNLENVKHYVYNETGNIMLSSTDSSNDLIAQSVRDVFAEVSVFFAAMTKAISQTINPKGKPDAKGNLPYYSLYNYDALSAVIDGSGYFVHVNEEDVSYTTSSWGVDFSKELFEAILGLATGTGAIGFASAMVNSMGKEGLSISGQSSSLKSRVANIIFVCEYLLGMPVVSALVVTADASEVSQSFTFGPCFKEQTKATKTVVHKDTYMFVTPAFIKQYSTGLDTGMKDPAYLDLIMNLQSLVERTPAISGVNEVLGTGISGPIVNQTLEPTKSYIITGQYLGDSTSQGTISLAPVTTGVTITESEWDDDGIKFKVANTNAKDTPNEQVNVTLKDGTTVLSAGVFTIAKNS